MIKSPALETRRHSCSHILASAVLKLYPETKLGIGPAIEEGFYYDFDFAKPISEKDLVKITQTMTALIKKKLPFEREEISISEAQKLFRDQPLKLELISDLSKDGAKNVSVYKTGDPSADSTSSLQAGSPRPELGTKAGQVFVDLCQGPHVEDTSQIGPFQLLSLAGAYWRGSEKNKMLTRIYGTVFETKKALAQYLWRLEEAKKRDHRKLGKELELFLISEEVGPGLPIILPKGNIIIKELQKYARELQKERGYQEVISPHLGKKGLWVTSGHWDHYQDLMFPPMKVENDEYLIKTMNCPFHIAVYKNKTRSYKDLPYKISEFATVYRYEKSGELAGLLRVREVTQDDAHIFCTQDQLEEEIWAVIDLMETHFKTLRLNDYTMRLSLRDPQKKKDYLGENKLWEIAERSLEKAIKKRGIEVVRGIGEAAFYGPKIDPIVKDALGREWQFGTIQLDFMLPERFNLTYIDSKGFEKRPVMIHRAPLGAFERTLGILIEHYGGAFPLWLSPVQVMVIPIADRHQKYAQAVVAQLKNAGLRLEFDDRQETMQAKIRDATLQKVPYMVIIGDREDREGNISLRTRSGEDLGKMDLAKLITKIKLEIKNAD